MSQSASTIDRLMFSYYNRTDGGNEKQHSKLFLRVLDCIYLQFMHKYGWIVCVMDVQTFARKFYTSEIKSKLAPSEKIDPERLHCGI